MENFTLCSQPVQQPLLGQVYIPGDKSISHRAVLLNSIAFGTAIIEHALLGKDNLATINAMRMMGVTINILDEVKGKIQIHGVGLQGLKAPIKELDFANSGTALRLIAGILAGQNFSTTLVGDASLSRRPMQRIIQPLRLKGSQISSPDDNRLPLTIQPVEKLTGITYKLPVASAQVKSCVLLAGLYAEGETIVIEPELTRDHTERMLVKLQADIHKQGLTTRITNKNKLLAQDMFIPGDISSAAFFIVAATLIPNSHIILKQVGINPSRTGVIDILRAMGANITLLNIKDEAEPYADIEVKYAPLHGIQIPKNKIVSAMDEFPIIFIAAACAKSITRLENAAELTVKESNRLATMHEGLKKCGIQCTLLADGIEIVGGEIQGADIDTQGDHRIAMAFLIAGCIAKKTISVNFAEMIETSFPDFAQLGIQLGMNLFIKDPILTETIDTSSISEQIIYT